MAPVGTVFNGLREQVFEANREIVRAGLVILTFGNASAADRAAGVMAIKPSGVADEELGPESMVVVDLESGTIVEGDHRPSSDTPTHLVLYREFERIGGVVHTHSPFATAWAQACREIPCLGTTHADHFNGPVPVTRALTPDEIEGEYEQHTGEAIVETFTRFELDPLDAGGARRPPWAVCVGNQHRTSGRECDRARSRGGVRAPDRAAVSRRPSAGRRQLAAPTLPAQARPGRVLRPESMKALHLHGRGDLRLHDEPAPTPSDGEVLVWVTGSGSADLIGTGSSRGRSATLP